MSKYSGSDAFFVSTEFETNSKATCVDLEWHPFALERPVCPLWLTTATHSSRCLEAFHYLSVVSGWWSIATWANRRYSGRSRRFASEISTVLPKRKTALM